MIPFPQIFNWISFHDFSEEDEDSANNISSTLSFAWHPVEESIIMAIGRNGRLAECHVPGKHINIQLDSQY